MRWMLLLSTAWATPPAEPLRWTDLPDAIAESFDRAVGLPSRVRADGMRSARDAVPTGLDSVFAQLEPDLRPSGNPWEGVHLAAQLELGRQRSSARGAWEAGAYQLDSARAEDRRLHASAVRQAWLQGWIARTLAEHLDVFAAELEAEIAPLREAAAAGLFPQHTLADVEAELARTRHEAHTERLTAADADVTLAATLQRSVQVDPTGMPDLDADPVDPTNPWPAVRAALAGHPALVALDAARAAALADARQAARSPTAQLGLGAVLRGDPAGPTHAVPLITLQAPLANAEAPLARAHRAEAEALRLEREQLAARLAAELDAEERAWTTAITRLEHLELHAEAPLRARYERLRDALAAGAVDAVPVLLAIRDLHAIHHAHALAVGDLYLRRARADTRRRALTGSPR